MDLQNMTKLTAQELVNRLQTLINKEGDFPIIFTNCDYEGPSEFTTIEGGQDGIYVCVENGNKVINIDLGYWKYEKYWSYYKNKV